ncbi:MAG: hypothetical protein BZ138_00655 [Methanosphaera sp. rholeuAM270]|nr:MAG: hypothetical protein BZ138_00655 [Methanosphaera sp. rholeuAM270]
MEYLDLITDPLEKINEKNILYLNLFNHPSMVFGTNSDDVVDFSKYPESIQGEISQQYPEIKEILQENNTSTSGCRIRFKTNLKRIVFKVKLRKAVANENMVMANSSGFAVYLVDKYGNYKFNRMIIPPYGVKCFAEQIMVPMNSSLCIFLPNFDTVEEMYIGFLRKAKVSSFNYPRNNRLPIIFYGSGIAQGASAAKSANSYPNIVSRRLNHDIINLSVDACSKATPKTAEMIGNIDCDAVVIDYSSDATNKKEFEENYSKFYRKIREYHPDKKIILLTSAIFNDSRKYDGFDEIIQKTYEHALSNGEKTYLINQKELFDQEDYDLISFNINHLTDYAMFNIAEKICELLHS